MDYWSPDVSHRQSPAVGILVANLGTPDEPTAPALRRYLRPFLSDPRVIELPKWKWLPILNLFVLTRRPKESAALYREIWTEEGSPLLLYTETIASEIEERLREGIGPAVHTAVGMRYGEPSLRGALRELAEKGCRKILVFPLYPHYSGTSTASVFDAVFDELKAWRWVPELRTIQGYHDEEGYLDALAASIRERWEADGTPDRLLLSFHGIPLRYFRNGDPYYCHCQKTGRLLRERLDWPEEKTLVTFQSLFGKEEWLKPYTDVTVGRLGREGLGRLDVACPGFAVDCLETLEEIDGLNRKIFLDAGGGEFRFVPCLNDREDHLEFLTGLARRHLRGWEQVSAGEETLAAEERAERARRQAQDYPSPALGAVP
ncbi:MAG: ferrochelatase [Thermoanaerobaculia bacterium]|nr:ferrochelatase [Thermoanaerobaculia bacterium]